MTILEHILEKIIHEQVDIEMTFGFVPGQAFDRVLISLVYF